MRLRGAALLLPAALLAGAPAGAAGLRDLADAWLLEPEDTAALLGAVGGEGGAVPLRWAWGTGRLHGLPSLDLRCADAAGRARIAGVPWRVAVGWQVLGRDLYRSARWTAAAGTDGTVRLGLHAAREREDLAGIAGPPVRELDLVLGARSAPAAGLVAAWELWAPLERPDAGSRRRVRRAGRVRLRAAHVAVALVADRRGDGTLLLGGELQVAVGAVVLTLRHDGGSGAVGPGLALRRGPLLLRTHHAAHPLLGPSHRVEVVVAPAWTGTGR